MRHDIKFARNALFATVGSEIILLVLENQYGTTTWYGPAVVAFVASLTIGLAVLIFEFRREIPDLEIIQEPVNQKLEALTEATNKLEKELRQDLEVARDLVRLLSQDSRGLIRTRMSLSERGEVVRRMGNRTLDEFQKLFRTTRGGYEVQGEHQSLMAYRVFWQELVRLQQAVKKSPGYKQDEMCLIARVTHSNDVELWMPEHYQIAHDLITLQKKFRDEGGIIVRLLVSTSPEPDENHETTIHRMTEAGIEARFLHDHLKFDYDFLWVSSPNHNIVLTWHSGQNGKGLSHCRIMDKVEPSILSLWERLAGKSEMEKGQFTSIPAIRHIFDSDQAD